MIKNNDLTKESLKVIGACDRQKIDQKKVRNRKMFGVYIFFLFCLLSLANSFLGLYVQLPFALLCFCNSMTFFVMAIESWYVYVEGGKKKEYWLKLQYEDDE
jgi:hypothetical protein